MTPFESDLEKLKKADPKTDDELDQVLGLSPSSPESYYAALVFDRLKSLKSSGNLEERFRQCVEENAKLKEEIRLAGGWLQPDSSYKWAYWQEDGNFILLPVERWVEQRKADARLLAKLRRIREVLNGRPDVL